MGASVAASARGVRRGLLCNNLPGKRELWQDSLLLRDLSAVLGNAARSSKKGKQHTQSYNESKCGHVRCMELRSAVHSTRSTWEGSGRKQAQRHILQKYRSRKRSSLCEGHLLPGPERGDPPCSTSHTGKTAIMILSRPVTLVVNLQTNMTVANT